MIPKRNKRNYLKLPYNPKLKPLARQLRKAGNLAEVVFWNEVKNGKFRNIDFDRQKIIGDYIVDFYSSRFEVVIEIDGSSHDEKQDYDAERDLFLKSLNLTVIRIEAKEVLQNLKLIMNWLYEHPALSEDGK